MSNHATDARPEKGHIWFAIIGSHVGSYCRDDTSIESAVKRVVRFYREDFKQHDIKAIDVNVYHVPDAGRISWDHQGFVFDKEFEPMTFKDAGARCFNADAQHGNIITEWTWVDGRGWV